MKLPAAVSLAIHAALVSVFFLGARFRPQGINAGFPGDFMPVSVVSSEMLRAAPAPAPAPAAEVPPPPKPRAPEKVKAVPPALKPEKDPGIKLPDESKKPPKPAPADTAVSAAASENATEAAPASADPAAAALAGVPEAPAAHGGAVAAGIEGDGGGGGGGGGFGDFAYYRIAMQNRIATNWSPGFVSGEATCIVYFRIIRSGLVVGARVEQTSGIPFYDQTAVRAVLESSPLPPLPAQFPEDAVGVHFRFRYQP